MSTPTHAARPGQYPDDPDGWHYYGPPEPPRKKHRIRNAIVGASAAFVVMGVIGAALGDGDTSGDGTGGGQGAAAAADTGEKKAAAKDDGDDKRKTVPGIGDKARDGKFTFLVTKIGKKSRIGDEYLGKKAQGQFILVQMSITNHGDEPQSMFGDNQYLYSADGKKYSADTEAAIYLGDQGSTLWEEINPGNTLKGTVVFDVPTGLKADHLELHDSMFSGGVNVRL